MALYLYLVSVTLFCVAIEKHLWTEHLYKQIVILFVNEHVAWQNEYIIKRKPRPFLAPITPTPVLTFLPYLSVFSLLCVAVRFLSMISDLGGGGVVANSKEGAINLAFFQKYPF